MATVRLAADASDAAVVPLLGDAGALVSGRFSEGMAHAANATAADSDTGRGHRRAGSGRIPGT